MPSARQELTESLGLRPFSSPNIRQFTREGEMNTCLLPVVTRSLAVALVTACWTTVSLAQGGPPQGPPGGMGVTVLNTPLPVTQGGPWTVQVVNPSNAPTATDIAKAMGIQHPYHTSVICKWNGGNGCT